MDEAQTIENIRFALELRDAFVDIVTDAEISRYILLYPSDWRLAAAALADALAVRAINRPTSFSAPGQMAISWADRSRGWLAIGKALREQVASDDQLAAASGTVSVVQLERIGIELEDPEYVRERRHWRLS